MNSNRLFSHILIITSLLVLSVRAVAFAQPLPIPDFGPPQRPLVKLVGFLDPDPPKNTTNTILTIAFPGDEKRYTFLLKQFLIMAGPLRTPGDILDEVRPYSTNFYIRAPQEIVAQIKEATPAEPVAILAEYSSADRGLMVSGVEINPEAQEH